LTLPNNTSLLVSEKKYNNWSVLANFHTLQKYFTMSNVGIAQLSPTQPTNKSTKITEPEPLAINNANITINKTSLTLSEIIVSTFPTLPSPTKQF
jgi:hypothetical protein